MDRKFRVFAVASGMHTEVETGKALTPISISSSVGLLRGCRALYHVSRTRSRPSRMPTDTV
jgi:hypothetical protein